MVNRLHQLKELDTKSLPSAFKKINQEFDNIINVLNGVLESLQLQISSTPTLSEILAASNLQIKEFEFDHTETSKILFSSTTTIIMILINPTTAFNRLVGIKFLSGTTYLLNGTETQLNRVGVIPLFPFYKLSGTLSMELTGIPTVGEGQLLVVTS